MLKVQQEICEQILQEIMNIPVSRLFLECPLDPSREKIEKPISLQFISGKLKGHLYKSPIDFISDMRLLLGNQLQISFVDPFKKEAAEYLAKYFEELIKKKPPNSNNPMLLLSHLDDQLSLIQNDLSIILLSKENEMTSEESDFEEGASEIVNQAHYFYSVKNAKFLLNLLQSYELLAYAAIYLQKIQPEAVVFDPELVFDFSIMTVANRRKFCKFLRRLISNTASGKIQL